MLLLFRASRPYVAHIGKVPGTPDQYGDMARHPENVSPEGVTILRFESGLFFANADWVRNRIRTAARGEGVTGVVLDAESVPSIDVTAARMLAEVADELQRDGIGFVMARDVGQVRDILREADETRPATHGDDDPGGRCDGLRQPQRGERTVSAEFRGKISLDVRDSEGDWPAFLPDKAPEGSPNVLVVLYDDTGQAAWSPYGGRIEMPTMDRLAAGGLTYTQWHTTALCSPTRSTFLTGRNHHLNGFATISESSTGFPGYNSHIPPSNATMASVLREAGWSTFWVGKNHNVPIDEWTMGASKKRWPLGQGYDQFYGFIGGETNNWYPSLAEGNRYIEQPYGPEDGYHLSKDLADQALRMIRDTKQTEPDKPWYLWFCPGANHAPHHAPQEYIDKYKGVFDDGYEAYREWVLARMIAKEIVPEGTELTPMNPMPEGTYTQTDHVRPWAELDDAERAMFCRMAEVYAGFSEYTDAQVGRIVDYLEESGQLDNTLILYCADNGASGEGSPNGSVNEGKIFGGYPGRPRAEPVDGRQARLARHLQPLPHRMGDGLLDALPDVQALHVPGRGVRPAGDPLAGRDPGQGRGAPPVPPLHRHRPDDPRGLRGASSRTCSTAPSRRPLSGVSMAYSFDDGDAPTAKETQYYEMLGNRGIWHKGWKAVAEHGPMAGTGRFEDDVWQLFHTDEDRAEAHDLAAQHPEKVEELKALWMQEAEANLVLPLNDLQIIGNPKDFETFVQMEFHIPVPPSGRYVYYPGTSEIPERSAANVHNVSYKVLAEVELTPDSQGVIFAHGSRFGGHALFVKDGQVDLRLQLPRHPARGPAHRPRCRPTGPTSSASSSRRSGWGRTGRGSVPRSCTSTTRWWRSRRSAPSWGTSPSAARGCASATTAPTPSRPRTPGTGSSSPEGRSSKVVFDVADDAYIDVEAHLAAAMARD